MSTLKRFAGQTAIYGLTTIASRVLTFFLTPVYVRQFSPGAFGVFTNMFAWASIINAILAFGMETTFFRYLTKYKDRKDVVYANAFLCVALLAATFFCITLFSASKIAAWMQPVNLLKQKDYVEYIRMFGYILAIDALNVIPFAKIRAENRPIRYGWIKCLNIAFFIGLNLVFIFLIPYLIKNQLFGYRFLTGHFRGGWIGYVFIANLMASALTLIMLLPELLKLRLRFDKVIFLDMLSYSWPILVANLSFVINENVDKLFLQGLLPAKIAETQVGIYGACAKLAVFLSIFVQAFRLGAEPFYFSQSGRDNAKQTYARIMDYFIIAIILATVALVANIEILKYFIKGNTPGERALYWSGLRVVPILLMGYVSLGIYMNLSVWYKLSDQTRFGLYISGAGAIVTIILNLIFIPLYGFMAAAWVSLTAYASMMVLSYVLGNRNYPIPYNIKKNGLYLLAGVVCIILCFVVFNRNLIIGNAIFLLFLSATIFSERNELKRIWNQVSK